jgi:hypothetical protein
MSPPQRPTELATMRFVEAGRRAANVKDVLMKDPRSPISQDAALVLIGQSIAELALGMVELSNGLRATYILIEQNSKK